MYRIKQSKNAHACYVYIMFQLSADGTDPDTYNFEYVLKKEENGDTYLTIVWTGNFKLIYEENKEYNITITPSRLVWGSLTYIRR